MPTVNQVLAEVRHALEVLRHAAAFDGDDRRAHAADWVEAHFAEARTPFEVRQAAAGALTLYRGGMGSFQDVGTSIMADAVDGLWRALRRARSAFLRP
ncbi:hypothetical protein JTF08_09810 [Micrococcaceae bacterium RIT802]|nr:hypothetical protein [Micrococcaceae bacterium RIT 802]